MKKYAVHLIILAALFALLIFLNQNGNPLGFKIVGLILLLVSAFLLITWIKQSQTSSAKKNLIRLTANDKYWLNEEIHFYNKLAANDKVIFEERIRLFLGEIIVTEVGKEMPEKDTCFYVASSAVIAFWGLPYWNYGRLSEVLVYPANFDEDNQFTAHANVLGKVHHGGLMDSTMILSLPALKAGFKKTHDQQNVGVHEFSHLIDKADGTIDGLPIGMNAQDEIKWIHLVELEIANIQERKSDINPYGATNKAEFFAVIMEYYKEDPTLLEKKHPQLFEILDRYFNAQQSV